MKQFQNIVIGLDLTEMDDSLIRYAAYLCDLFPNIDRVTFFHNIKFDFPAEESLGLKELNQPLDRLISEGIQDKLDTFFHPNRRKREQEALIVEIEVTNERSTPHIFAKVCNWKSAELAVVGKKIAYRGSGSAIERMLRLESFRSSLLMIPETTSASFSKILVPTDFSKDSLRALKMAQMLRQEAGADVFCQHVFSIPAHYFPYIPVKGMRQSMLKKAQQSYEKFKKRLDKEGISGCTCSFTFNEGRTVAETVYQHAIEQHANLIVIGSKGRSGLPAVFVGSVALQLLRFDFHIPLMIVRQ